METIKDLSVKTRLTFLIALSMLLVAATGLLSLSKLHGVARAIDSVYANRLLPMQQLRLVSQAFAVELRDCAQGLADGQLATPQALQQLDHIEQQIHQQWRAYLGTELVEPEQRLVAEAQPLLAQGLQELTHLRERLLAGDRQALQGPSQDALKQATAALTPVLDRLLDVQLENGKNEALAGHAAFDEAAWLVLGLGLSTGALGLLLGGSIWRRHRREQDAIESSRARAQQFYVALSQTNQLIVRLPESAEALYEGLCRICVETGQARLASVVLFDGEQFERVAVHGPVEQLMPGVPVRWHRDSAFAQASMSSEVVRSGRHVLSNQVLDDAQRAQWRAGVIPPGVEAMAAFPLRRAGRVVGALSLLAGQRDFFDAAALRLLDEMAGDVAFALDNLDREQARRQALAQAEAGLALFRRLFNNSAVSVIVTTLAEGRVLEINEVMCRRYGYGREALLGRRLVELQVGLEDEDRARFYAQMRQQGQVRNMELRAAQQEAQARAGAEAANRAKTEFLAQMSHELRTPLNALLGFTQLLEADAQALPAAQREWLAHMRRAGWHLLGLIKDVLDISRIETGQLPLQPEPLCLTPLLAEVLALSEGQARERGVTLLPLTALAAGLGVRADRRRLQQVLLNLLSNGIKYNHPGGSLTLTAEAEAARVRLRVRDTGPGMDEAQLAQLFTPFNRLGREHGGVEGSGIGLALSQQLMRLMDGQITVSSAPGRGTEVCLELPRADDHTTASAAAATTPALPPAAGRVLYIEDNAVNRLLVEQMLARWPDLLVECAEDGETGLRRAAELRPDLVLLDMQLPDIHGREVLRRLRADARTAALPVVALSASAMADDVAEMLAAGALDYWSKPLELGPFLEKMRRLLPSTSTPTPTPS